MRTGLFIIFIIATLIGVQAAVAARVPNAHARAQNPENLAASAPRSQQPSAGRGSVAGDLRAPGVPVLGEPRLPVQSRAAATSAVAPRGNIAAPGEFPTQNIPRGAQGSTGEVRAPGAPAPGGHRLPTQSRAAATTAVAHPGQATRGQAAAARAPAPPQTAQRGNVQSNAIRSRTAVTNAVATRRTSQAARSATVGHGGRVARAAATNAVMTSRVGAEYEQCRSALFACMDQFCALRNERFRRCSCSDRVFELEEAQARLHEIAVQLNEFNTGLDAVTMSEAEARAMRTATEGELAMGEDNSAARLLLNAIMNSISGAGETQITQSANPLARLNAVSFDEGGGIFSGGGHDAQSLAALNGRALYSASFTQCRNIIRPQCEEEALQRAVTAYLMAIENDCVAVNRHIDDSKRTLEAAARESNAMLRLARVEDRQNRNALDAAQCLNAVDAAIKDDAVCGAGFQRCLDSGEFIDRETGRPFPGVVNFYQLENLLTFDRDVDITQQRLSQNPLNRQFVDHFVMRNKRFAEPVLGQCVEIADQIWTDFLDRALIEIFYAQQDKVNEIRRGCFDLITVCRTNTRDGITEFMRGLLTPSLAPEVVSLTSEMCDDFTQSCNQMFTDDFIRDFVDRVDMTDKIAACREIAMDCYESFGGQGMSNFFNPRSGLFDRGRALDWFTLYDSSTGRLVSQCARRLYEVAECRDDIELIFGGFDADLSGDRIRPIYGALPAGTKTGTVRQHAIRPQGVATEMYNRIVGLLRMDCRNMFNADFAETRVLPRSDFCLEDNMSTDLMNISCRASFNNNPCYSTLAINTNSTMGNLACAYNFSDFERVCPDNYEDMVDVWSWGICSCWHNGARRRVAGTRICQAVVPKLASGRCLNTRCDVGRSGHPICASDPADRPAGSTFREFPLIPNPKINAANQVCPGSFAIEDFNDGFDQRQLVGTCGCSEFSPHCLRCRDTIDTPGECNDCFNAIALPGCET